MKGFASVDGIVRHFMEGGYFPSAVVSVFDQNGNGTEGNGITPDDVNSLINGMQ